MLIPNRFATDMISNNFEENIGSESLHIFHMKDTPHGFYDIELTFKSGTEIYVPSLDVKQISNTRHLHRKQYTGTMKHLYEALNTLFKYTEERKAYGGLSWDSEVDDLVCWHLYIVFEEILFMNQYNIEEVYMNWSSMVKWEFEHCPYLPHVPNTVSTIDISKKI